MTCPKHRRFRGTCPTCRRLRFGGLPGALPTLCRYCSSAPATDNGLCDRCARKEDR